MATTHVLFAYCRLVEPGGSSALALRTFHAYTSTSPLPSAHVAHPHPGIVTVCSAKLDETWNWLLTWLETNPLIAIGMDVGRPLFAHDADLPLVAGRASFHARELSELTSANTLTTTERALSYVGGTTRFEDFTTLDATLSLIEPSTRVSDFDDLEETDDASLRELEELASRAISEIDTHGPYTHLSALSARTNELDAAIQWTHSHAPERCARLLENLSRWMHPCWMSPSALDACGDLADEHHPQLVLLRTRQLREQGRREDAMSMCEALLAHPSATVSAEAHNEMGLLHYLAGHHDDALEYYESAVALAEAAGLDAARGWAHRGLAASHIQRALGGPDSPRELALSLFERAADYTKSGNDRQRHLMVLAEMGQYCSRFDPDKAHELLSHVADSAREIGLSRYAFLAKSALAAVALRRRELARARSIYVELYREENAYDIRTRLFLRTHDVAQCLHERRFDDAYVAISRIERLNTLHDYDYFTSFTTRSRVLLAILTRRYWLLEGELGSMRGVNLTLKLLARICIRLWRGESIDEGDAMVTELVDELVAQDEHSPYDEWRQLLWNHLASIVPSCASSCAIPVAVVSSGCEWLVAPNGARHDIARRPYIHRMLAALVETHASETLALQTIELFERGWPGEVANLENMRNRVYVGLSHLRKMGLKTWIIRREEGYALDHSLTLVVASDSAFAHSSSS